MNHRGIISPRHPTQEGYQAWRDNILGGAQDKRDARVGDRPQEISVILMEVGDVMS